MAKCWPCPIRSSRSARGVTMPSKREMLGSPSCGGEAVPHLLDSRQAFGG